MTHYSIEFTRTYEISKADIENFKAQRATMPFAGEKQIAEIIAKRLFQEEMEEGSIVPTGDCFSIKATEIK